MTLASAQPSCAVCTVSFASTGVLCDLCAGRVTALEALSPEQIDAHVHDPTRAALVDSWGRVYRLAATTRVGRTGHEQSLLLLTPTVSRHHAELVWNSGTWSVRDLGSANGTSIGAVRIDNARLTDRCVLRFARIRFFFIADAMHAIRTASPRASTPTIRPAPPQALARATTEIEPQVDDAGELDLQQPTGGGGAVLTVRDRVVQLSIAQHDLMVLLSDRMLTQQHLDVRVRGFVSMRELLTRLSLDSRAASEDNVRQLVRRVRRSLVKAGIGDLIESRPGYGYRLLVPCRAL